MMKKEVVLGRCTCRSQSQDLQNSSEKMMLSSFLSYYDYRHNESYYSPSPHPSPFPFHSPSSSSFPSPSSSVPPSLHHNIFLPDNVLYSELGSNFLPSHTYPVYQNKDHLPFCRLYHCLSLPALSHSLSFFPLNFSSHPPKIPLRDRRV